MLSTECPTDEVIALYLSGHLDDARVASFRQHIDGCDSCRVLIVEAGRSGSVPMEVAEVIHETRVGQPRGKSLVGRLALGDMLGGKYRIDALLGTGGMGTVLRGTHMELGRSVAIKIMHAELLAASDAGRRFSREARASAAIESHHAVRILDIDRLPTGVPYMVMEYLEGKDLHQVLTDEGPLTVGRVIDYVMQASDAIGEAHSRGIIHRDLKPHNLFLTQDDVVKVVDFGLAKTLPDSTAARGSSNDTKTTSLIGTPHYMAPEQIRASRSVDARTDIYGLGATMYQLLTGLPPFVALNLYVLCARILSDAPPPIHRTRKDVSPALEAVIMRCLEKAPAARYASVAELSEALDAARASEKAGDIRDTPRDARLASNADTPRNTPGLDPVPTQRDQDIATLPGLGIQPPVTVALPGPVTTIPLTVDQAPSTDPAPPPMTERIPPRRR